jgi:hypothetical protein
VTAGGEKTLATKDEIRAVKKRHSAALLRRPGVCGVNVGVEPDGQAVLEVHLDSSAPEVRSSLPECIEGYPVKYLHTGPFRKLEETRE